MKGKFAKRIISFVIGANVIFTILVLYLFFKTGLEPQTLITTWFAFTTVEVWQLAKIKMKKVEKDEN